MSENEEYSAGLRDGMSAATDKAELVETLAAITYWHDEGRAIDESWWESARALIAKYRGVE